MIPFFYPIGYLLFVLFAHLLLPFNTKIRSGILGKYRAILNLKALKIPQGKKVYWFHVASSGEFEQVLPILDRIKENANNQSFIFITYYSPSGERALKLEKIRREKARRNISWDFADYSPFDLRFLIRSLLKRIKPVAFVTIHREIWPSILMECAALKIPCYLFSAYFPAENTTAFWRYSPWMQYFKMVGTVDEESVSFLKSKVPSISAKKVGDSRIERVVSRRKLQTSEPPYASFFEKQKVVIAGSVWPKDFEKILKALLQNKEKRFIFAPHEPTEEFSNHMIEALKKQGHKARLWSRWLLEPDTTSQLIYDQVGGLFELYSIAHVAFVGGSFARRVHNVLEPAAFGLPILTGPLIANSREALELLKVRGLFKCEDAEEVSQVLKSLDEKQKHQETSECVNLFIQQGLGASQIYAQLLTSI